MNTGGTRRGRGRAGPGLRGPRPRGRGHMMGMRPQMMRPNQPFGQFRPRMQPFRPNFEGSPGNFNQRLPAPNQPPFRGQPRMRGFSRPMKRSLDANPENVGPGVTPKKVKSEMSECIAMQLIPKDAISCLNAIESNVDKSITIRSSNDNITNCKIASIKFQNSQVHGYGATDELAKQVVAENALRTLVTNPDPDDEFSVDTVKGQDLNIWKSILSYSIYKMVKDWCGDRVGLQPRENWLGSAGMLITSKYPKDDVHSKHDPEFVEAALRRLPASPETYHPSVLLNSVCPGLQCDKIILPDGRIKLSAIINGQHYTGEDVNAKLARARLGYKVVKELFNMECNCPAQLKDDQTTCQ